MAEPSPRRVEELFEQAIDLHPTRLAALLDEECKGDADLRATVEKLLHLDSKAQAAESLLRSPLAGARSPAGAHAAPPTTVGRYRVIRLLGEGGMGSVYEAEQESPRRTVALKVIRAGLASEFLLKRFAREAEILGRLRHHGIAHVYDAGVAERGQPYFAMELVAGIPLDRFASERTLDVPARLELVARVCDAVLHAHEKGVIHRDLKPGNILVEASGQPKVLDFGVARAVDAGLTGGQTETGQLIGTLNYMSPEQASGDPSGIDARGDVYALGVILYELLAHRLPYSLDGLPLPEAVRLIREQEPSRLGSLDTHLRGDVETIVAKALEKDKARRYGSAGELAADIRRHLHHEPIQARPTSALYRLRKFTRRHKALVAGTLSVFAALLVGTVVSSWYAITFYNPRRTRMTLTIPGYQNARELAEANALQANYRARLAAATAALSAHDVADAARQLKAAPEELRGWEWRHLHSRLDDRDAVVSFPDGQVNSLLVGADRLCVATMTEAGVCLTDLGGGPPATLPIPPQSAYFNMAALTRQGLRVGGWIGDTTFVLLDESGQELCRGTVEQLRHIQSIFVSPDGKRLACYWHDGERERLAVFDATTGRRTADCDPHEHLYAVAFSPDGTLLVTAGDDPAVRVLDAATGKELAACRGRANKVLAVGFRPDGRRLATGSADGTVCQWDPATGREVEPAYERHTGEVAAVAYSPDGERVASAGTDRTVRVWMAEGRQDVAVLHGHTGAVVSLAFTPDGRRLVSLSSWGHKPVSSWDSTARVWDMGPTASLPVLRGHTSYVYPVTFSPDGRWIASGGWDEKDQVRLWDAATGEPCATLQHPTVVRCLAYSPDGAWLASAGDSEDLRIWDAATARLRKRIPVPAGIPKTLAVRPDGKRVAVRAADRQGQGDVLGVCDVESGEWLYKEAGGALAYSPDGRWLAALVADEKSVLLLDAETHRTVARLDGHEKSVHSAVFSPDSRLLATCSLDRTVRLWPVEGGACRVLRGHTDEVFAVAFHPDGKRLATAGRDRAVWLWDVERGEEVARLPGHANYVWSLAFSPDGATLASGSGDSTVRLWDTAPLRERYQARREVEAARPEATRLVQRLLAELGEPGRVDSRLRTDASLSDALRRAASREILRQASN